MSRTLLLSVLSLLLLSLGLLGCKEAASPSEPTPVQAEMCAPSCLPTDPMDPNAAPPGTPWNESICYDGCNWCFCTTDGAVDCTARDCTTADAFAADPDAGL